MNSSRGDSRRSRATSASARTASDNLLIKGDNLAALDVLLPAYAGKVRCIYIDPPYNNQERYLHYDDKLDHEDWLAGLEARLVRLGRFLRDDGSLWISIDDRNMHYLKVLADKVVGRERFVATIVWEHRTTRENRRAFSNNHEYILVYAADPERFKRTRNGVPATPELLNRYRNPDADPRGPWQSVSANVQAGHATLSQFYELVSPGGRRHSPPNGRCWVYTKERMHQAIADGRIWFGTRGEGVPRIKRFLAEAAVGLTPDTLWRADAVGTTLAAKRHLLAMFPGEAVFETPKPEELLRRVLDIATDPGDLVLDAYLGSGTTCAVAHKMGRRWIGIEAGVEAARYSAERLRRVVKGEDDGGVSEELGWTGGGDFELVESLSHKPSDDSLSRPGAPSESP